MPAWLRFLAIFWLLAGSALALPSAFGHEAAPFPQGGEHPQAAAIAELPREARETLGLIRQGGPFPYPKDGAVFGNFERRLPARPRGYYREYTVKTPGSRDRGARRIIAGDHPPLIFYYTTDHYRTFRRIEE